SRILPRSIASYPIFPANSSRSATRIADPAAPPGQLARMQARAPYCRPYASRGTLLPPGEPPGCKQGHPIGARVLIGGPCLLGLCVRAEAPPVRSIPRAVRRSVADGLGAEALAEQLDRVLLAGEADIRRRDGVVERHLARVETVV